MASELNLHYKGWVLLRLCSNYLRRREAAEYLVVHVRLNQERRKREKRGLINSDIKEAAFLLLRRLISQSI